MKKHRRSELGPYQLLDAKQLGGPALHRDSGDLVHILLTGCDDGVWANWHGGSSAVDIAQRLLPAALQLRHPSLFHTLDGGVSESAPAWLWIAVDADYGESIPFHGLGIPCYRTPTLTSNATVFVASRLLSVLVEAHALGAPHGRVVAPWIRITRDGEIKLTGFPISAAEEASRHPKAHYHFSPYSLFGRPCDPRSDLWDIGVLMFQLLVGEHPYPYSEDNPADYLHALRSNSGSLDRLSMTHASEQVQRLTRALLGVAPSTTPLSARRALAALAQVECNDGAARLELRILTTLRTTELRTVAPARARR